eukprot:CAMPEP_0201488386 /NCGR_PEP_ID=MMETSP0151_2-20130828/17930_1 /ASSEMBLY_ACC=CAM_ASM_000257 /TAXON_ID=200890 /ORGANISM="Paramoeba atlantica, Strain 621/1 / CCAP 1560/9" /LENGTH=211 /DNA_ID=CAMNT_0047873661 /DNA_START=136 /DNA_END=767 /DNA_ORIENTATION=-
MQLRKPGDAVFSTWVKTELYFGLSYVNSTTGDTEEVTIEEFNQFVSDVVTPLYPDGLTLLPGKGQWQSLDSGQIIQESSMVMIIYHPDTKSNQENIQVVVTAYMDQFYQEAVLYGTIQAEACLSAYFCLSETDDWDIPEVALILSCIALFLIVILFALFGVFFSSKREFKLKNFVLKQEIGNKKNPKISSRERDSQEREIVMKKKGVVTFV